MPPIRQGQVISAQYLTGVSTAINSNTRALAGPKQQNALDESSQGGLSDLNFTETARDSTEIEATDSNGDTLTITQIDIVTLVNSAGETLTLTFNNPQ